MSPRPLFSQHGLALRPLILLSALALLVAGCDSSDDNGGQGGLALGSMTARIDGEPFQAVFAVATPCLLCEELGEEETIEVAGLDSENTGLGFLLLDFHGEGTYVFDPDGEQGGGAVDSPDGTSFATDWPGGSGSVEVTRSTDDAIEGTFSFTALTGPDGEVVRVTEGRFNVAIQELP